MIWIHAERVIATVTDMKIPRDWAILKDIGGTMRVHRLHGGHLEDAVAFAIPSTAPQPTAFIDINLRVEPQFSRRKSRTTHAVSIDRRDNKDNISGQLSPVVSRTKPDTTGRTPETAQEDTTTETAAESFENGVIRTGVPNGIRTRVLALKGIRPVPN